MAKYAIEDNTLTEIADAIRSKSGIAGVIVPEDMGARILGISGSDGGSIVLQSKSVEPSETAQTIKPDSGYGGLSQVSVGAIPSTYVGSGVTRKNAATITPGTTDQTIAAGQYLSGAQTIKGDANLKAANIKSGVSIFGVSGTASGGVTVQRKTGSFTTNSSGSATVNCGFVPDIVLITGLYDSQYKAEYHVACVFPERKQSNYDLCAAAFPEIFADGIEFYPTQTTNGFSIEIWENNTLLGDWYAVANMTFSYVAIKYTA